MPHRTTQEIEIKLRITDLREISLRLRRLRARRLTSVFERNDLFDTPGGYFFRTRQLFRHRWLLPTPRGASRRAALDPATARGRVALTNLFAARRSPFSGVITFKGRAKPSEKYKVREEVELHLPDAAQADRLLRSLGLAPWFRYEKRRTSFRLPRLPGLLVELDVTPIGPFLELEGPRQSIDRAARLLGYCPSDYITASYWTLYQEHRRSRPNAPANMVFPRPKK